MNDAQHLGTLSAEKLELLRLLRKGSPVSSGRAARPTPVTRLAEHPLSPAQRRFWFLEQLDPGNGSRNLGTAFRVRGPLRIGMLARAFSVLQERHEAVRTVFCLTDSGPVARPAGGISEPVIVEADDDVEAASAVREAWAKPFDLSVGPMVRLHVIRVAPQDHVVTLVAHHIVADGWSMDILWRDLSEGYSALVRGTEPAAAGSVQYLDYVRADEADVAGRQRDILYWKRRLTGAPPALEIPLDRARPRRPPHRGAVHQFQWSAGLMNEVRSLAADHQTSLFTVLFAGFGALLSKWTGAPDLVIGVPVANRNRSGADQVVGPFSNMLPLRLELNDTDTVDGLIEYARDVVAAGLSHPSASFGSVVETLGLRPEVERNPLFQVLFQLQNTPDFLGLDLPDCQVSVFPLQATTTGLDLEVLLNEHAGGRMLGAVTVNTDVLDAGRAETLATAYSNLIYEAAAQRGTRLGRLRVTGKASPGVNSTATVAEDVLSMIRRRVRAEPDRTVLAGPSGRVSARALWDRAGRVAARVSRAGVRPGDIVGLCLGRDIDLVVAVIGVWRAGAAYLPLDPEFPPERLAMMVEHSGATVVLVDDVGAEVAAGWSTPALRVDGFDNADERDALEPPSRMRVPVPRLAYVMYTSGSTGRPKGIAVGHPALGSFTSAVTDRVGIGPGDVLLAVTTLSFDISILELIATIAVGADVVVASNDDIMDARQLASLVVNEQATVMQATPVTWRMMLETAPGALGGLKVLSGGEALPADLARRLSQAAPAVWNLYGPTETTIWSTAHPVDELDTTGELAVVPIGSPLGNTHVRVLDVHGLPSIPGAHGELLIGGQAVAWGYWREPALTARCFLPDPLGAPGARRFRTNDLVATGPDGHLRFLGRFDDQVKLRGFRLELGEVEHVVGQHPAVQQCVGAIDAERLVIHVVPRALAGAPTLAELRDHCARWLPRYMIPELVGIHEALPLTPNGKIDRGRVRLVDGGPAPQSHRTASPTSDGERRVAAGWRDVLGGEAVGVHDNFFDVGGNSIRLTSLRTVLEKEFERDIAVVDLLQNPTIAAMWRHLEGAPDARREPETTDDAVRSERWGSGLARARRLRARTRETAGREGTDNE